jgi:hypothetical protein
MQNGASSHGARDFAQHFVPQAQIEKQMQNANNQKQGSNFGDEAIQFDLEPHYVERLRKEDQNQTARGKRQSGDDGAVLDYRTRRD